MATCTDSIVHACGRSLTVSVVSGIKDKARISPVQGGVSWLPSKHFSHAYAYAHALTWFNKSSQ